MASGTTFRDRRRLMQYKLDECPDYESVVTRQAQTFLTQAFA
jgi:hypothetical protein